VSQCQCLKLPLSVSLCVSVSVSVSVSLCQCLCVSVCKSVKRGAGLNLLSHKKSEYVTSQKTKKMWCMTHFMTHAMSHLGKCLYTHVHDLPLPSLWHAAASRPFHTHAEMFPFLCFYVYSTALHIHIEIRGFLCVSVDSTHPCTRSLSRMYPHNAFVVHFKVQCATQSRSTADGRRNAGACPSRDSHTATHCNTACTLQRTATRHAHCNTLQHGMHTATHCNMTCTLQHTCNTTRTLQHTAT